MKSSRKLKKSGSRSHQNNDVIITDEIESTESYVGVGENNIVNINANNSENFNANNYVKTRLTKPITKPSKPSELIFNEKLSKTKNLKFNYPLDNFTESKSNNVPITKKKIQSLTDKSNNESDNLQRLPPLPTKSNIDRELGCESVASINDQIEKLEYRKLKLSISEKKSRMKEILNQGRQNWSNFKAEIDFIKSVESGNGNFIHESETIIKDEKLLNVILNEIVIGEKENIQENLTDLNLVENNIIANDQQTVTTSEIVDNSSVENIEFSSLIKLMKKEYQSNKLSNDMALNLKQMLFNSTNRTWGSEWYRQNIQFHPIDGDKPFAIIQKYQGSDSIMTVIQAEFLVEALFCSDININWISNIKRKRNQILASALSRIISRCRKAESDYYHICLLDINLKGRDMGVVKPDGITECLIFYEISNEEEMKKFILININQFTDLYSPGLILLVMSCLLTYGIYDFKSKLDVNINRLINPLGFPVDELMNFLIHGTVTSHYFNDKIEHVDPESGQSTFHYGITNRSAIGFLTNETHCEYCVEVGTYLKTPKYPVWVVKWKANNFFVLYCHNRTLTTDWKTEIRFKLNLYSPLFKNHKLVTMTIDSSHSQMEIQKLDEQEIKRKLEAGKKVQSQTEQRLKNMSENTLKFLLEDNSIEDYMNDVNDESMIDCDRNDLHRLIHTKWPNAIVILDDDQLNVSNLFKH